MINNQPNTEKKEAAGCVKLVMGKDSKVNYWWDIDSERVKIATLYSGDKWYVDKLIRELLLPTQSTKVSQVEGWIKKLED